MKILYKHQNVMLGLLATHKQFAIFAEQGTGKTYPMLLHLTGLLRDGKIQNALVVAPKSALGSWRSDCNFLPPSRKKEVDKISFINYDKVWRGENYNHYFGAVVCDESHCIAKKNSKRTKFMMKFNEKSEYRYIMTGTPMGQGRLEDYWSQFEFLNHNYLGTWREFEDRYLRLKQLPNTYVKIVVGYRNTDELLNKISDMSFCVRKKDCLDLPEKMPDEVFYANNLEKKLMKEVSRGYVGFLEEVLDNPLVIASKLRQISTGFIYDENHNVHKLHSEKFGILSELIDSILPEKIVIFAFFSETIDNVLDIVKEKDVKYIVLDGRTKDKECWKKFQEDENIKIIICQYGTANAGINLYASSHMIFVEPPRETIIAEQARDRIHRVGQKNACNYYWLITKDTIEEEIYARLLAKQDFTNECMKKFVNKIGGINDIN